MKQTIVILLSDKRSGSTMLERELCSLAGVSHVEFTEHTYNETQYWIAAAGLLGSGEEHPFEGRYAGAYGSRKAALKALKRFLHRNIPDHISPHGDEELVFTGWEALCEHYAQPVFFEKSPQHPHHAPALSLMIKWIRQTDFQVKVVCLVRNPMAVMYSAFQLFQTDPRKRQFGWARAYRNILQFRRLLAPDQFHLIRYEDLVFDPKEELGKLCQFIGIENGSQLGSTIHGDSISKWKADPFFTLNLDPDVASLAEELGYSSVDLGNPDKPRPSLSLRLRRKIELTKKRTKSVGYRWLKHIKRGAISGN